MTVRFPKPVHILVGLGFPTKIKTANGALIILDDWHHERDATHGAATAACRDALLGRVSAEQAHAAFMAFAAAADILVDGSDLLALPKAARRHGAPA